MPTQVSTTFVDQSTVINAAWLNWVDYVVNHEPFDVCVFYPDVTTSNAQVIRISVARTVTFPANFSGSYASANTAATASTVFNVKKNGSIIGTITFAAGGTTATFTTSGGTAQIFAAGDVLSIVAPGSADATLADISFTLSGTR